MSSDSGALDSEVSADELSMLLRLQNGSPVNPQEVSLESLEPDNDEEEDNQAAGT